MGAFSGFAGGLGNGLQTMEQDQNNNNNGAGASKPAAGGGAAGLGGVLPIIKNALSGGQAAAAPAPAQAAAPGGIPAPPGAGSTVPVNNTINTQTQQSGFHGVAPMLMNYYQNHQAKTQDAAAQPHFDSLQDPSTTPEQRQYHVNNLQQIYANRPDVLNKMGLAAPGSPNIPRVQQTAPAPAAAAAPAASAGSGGNQ